MVDTRGFDGLPPVSPPDPDDIVAAIRERVAAAGEQAERARDDSLVGAAQSEDGQLRATVGEGGLQDLDIGERAMRLPSADLGPAIVAVVRDAESAYTDAVLATVGPALPRRPTQENLDNLEQLGRAGAAAPYELQDVFERFRRGVTG